MSNTELERLKRRLSKGYAALSRRAQPLLSRLGAREVEGEVLGVDGLPLEGVEVISRRGKRAVTNTEGLFSMRLWGERDELTLRRGSLELTGWVKVQLSAQRPARLRVRWPRFARGQLLSTGDRPLAGVRVTLNERHTTHTDLYGAFALPLLEGDLEGLDHFSFEVYGERFVHHFKGQLEQPPLRLFYYDEGELFYLRPLQTQLPLSVQVPTKRRRLAWLSVAVFTLSALMLLSALLPHPTPPTLSPPAHTFLAQELTPRLTSQRAPNAVSHDSKNEPPLSSGGPSSAPSNTQGSLAQEPKPCDEIEFTYHHYRVPRGMEGFLMSILFGSWQQWKGDLETLNNLSDEHQLQAGQFVKLKLPLHEWRLFTLYPDEGAQSLRDALECSEAHLATCLKLLQVWNPHLSVYALREGDRLLVNPSLLQKDNWSELVLRRLDQLKRSRARRLKRPRVKLSERCVVLPLRPEVAAAAERAERARLEALKREKEEARLARERKREQRRLERERKREERRRKRKALRRRKGRAQP